MPRILPLLLLAFASPRTPTSMLNGELLPATRIAETDFYDCPLNKSGTCVISR